MLKESLSSMAEEKQFPDVPGLTADVQLKPHLKPSHRPPGVYTLPTFKENCLQTGMPSSTRVKAKPPHCDHFGGLRRASLSSAEAQSIPFHTLWVLGTLLSKNSDGVLLGRITVASLVLTGSLWKWHLLISFGNAPSVDNVPTMVFAGASKTEPGIHLECGLDNLGIIELDHMRWREVRASFSTAVLGMPKHLTTKSGLVWIRILSLTHLRRSSIDAAPAGPQSCEEHKFITCGVRGRTC